MTTVGPNHLTKRTRVPHNGIQPSNRRGLTVLYTPQPTQITQRGHRDQVSRLSNVVVFETGGTSVLSGGAVGDRTWPKIAPTGVSYVAYP